ncbi:sigma-54-dependent transcriptional regulator [Luteithermobacter gelatinilyticus]|uniref:sigma-54-dependent transcriptional regulator FlbD n=1 Tax=Luteithermobacter gelatinilyticus TaxID=2582913 RepID=UPI001106946C|nr:sigma-54 dependent transcriptional regulator [Luteithermobacter gelatinilyticus]|tara:strand:- start:12882 stop:14264 length:1383 start_codon:yes stop_codon:yes gene_type:complete
MRLIIVGTLQGQLSTASRIAMQQGAQVMHVDDVDGALNLIRSKGADLLMVDIKQDIKGLIENLKTERISTPVVACGIGSNPDAAVRAIRAGAKEYIPLPPDPDMIAAVLTAISDDDHEFIYRDRAMMKVVSLADQVAPSEASILISGESGTGKEVMARYVHNKSRRAQKPYVSVNCAAIPENLLESELFGHEKGAFTGAVARRIGKFEEANGGTLLLDEISEMDIRLQAKLLRAIQEREIDRVGGSGGPVKVDIRIIATTNRNLHEEVKKGTFREDLLFRLNVVNLNLPPLRERPEDTRALCKHFARKYAEFNGLEPKPVSDEAMKVLINHDWPGNVRELENTMHRAVLLASGPEITKQDILLPDGRPHMAIQSSTRGTDTASPRDTEPFAASSHIGRTVADVERDLIIDTLKHCLGNRTHAANILGISIRTLRNKLNQYMAEGVAVPSPGEGMENSSLS